MTVSPRPNLFLIGAMKSGTTTLHSLLASHPDIFMCEPKEPCYFVIPEQLKIIWPDLWRKRYWENEKRYLDLFSEVTTERIIGEASTEYTKAPLLTDIPKRIAAFAPEARFIYVMRNPVERTISHFWHYANVYANVRDPLETIKADPHYCEVSDYAMQLKRYLEYFSIEQFYILTFEEFKTDPKKTIQDIYQWLGVDHEFIPDNLYAIKNVTPYKIPHARGLGLLHKIRFSKFWDKIGHHVPTGVRSIAREMSVKHIDKTEVDIERLRTYLKEHMSEKIKTLSTLLNRSFPEWE